MFKFIREASGNYKHSCFVLKLDIKKFFESVDHNVLLSIVQGRIRDEDLLWLLKNILKSFSKEKGIPIGNLTSQLFANIYLNELDQFVRQKLRIRYYIRFADDFIILDSCKDDLYRYTGILAAFLRDRLKLRVHPEKIILRKFTQGIDFLGYIVLPHYILPRTKTKNRIFRKLKERIEDFKSGEISEYSLSQSIASYLGLLEHADSFEFTRDLNKEYNL